MKSGNSNGFLAQVARQLWERYGDEVSSLYLIFPSRRARLFFVDALSHLAARPLWEPGSATVDELMSELSGQRAGERVRLLTELYKVWSRHHEESFDSFYYWGEMLLADFDAVDKYKVDARALFTNLRDLRALDADHSFLSEAQREAIQSFWAGFGPRDKDSPEQRAFLKVWDSLGAVYDEYRSSLSDAGIAYTGMMHRTAAENILAGGPARLDPARRYAVVGFNALSECEKVLFDHLREEGLAEFFWDYDEYYVNDPRHEAGDFMRANIRRYPPREPLPEGYDHFRTPKHIEIVSSPSDTLQCKYAGMTLGELPAPDKETAVVLADETLLETLLYSIPANVGKVNVTMGYPLRQTLAYSFAERLLELQRNRRGEAAEARFYHGDVQGLLRHPFVREQTPTDGLLKQLAADRLVWPPADLFGGNDFLKALFTPHDGWQATGEYLVDILSRVATGPGVGEDPLRAEFVAVATEEIRRLCNSLEGCGVDPSVRTLATLLRRHLQTLRIPYEGEPLQGVQVMGFLETRALDFENVTILSTGDDRLPGNRTASSSFIPHNLRAAYGLPTARDQEAIYAYYFYRLLQRSRRVSLVYCSRSDERLRGEPSRYIHQLAYESGHEILRREIGLDANVADAAPLTVAKEGEAILRLRSYLSTGGAPSQRRLSPTAFFSYVVCPLRFYYRYIAGIAPPEEMPEEVDARLFGNILHRAMEYLYEPLVGVDNPGERIRSLVDSPATTAAIARAVEKEYASGGGAYGGNLQLATDVVSRYINRGILPWDAAQRGLHIERLESPLEGSVDLGDGRAACFSGNADRIDRIGDGLLRVVDYKTARRDGPTLIMSFKDIPSLFEGPARGASKSAIQTLLYAMMLASHSPGREVQPAVFAVRHLSEPDYTPLLWDKEAGDYVTRYSDYAARFEEGLRGVLRELFDEGLPFRACDDERQCRYCDFKTMCGRGE